MNIVSMKSEKKQEPADAKKMNEKISSSSNNNKQASKKRSDGGWHGRTFPYILHDILSNPDYKDIISWELDGETWRIHDMKAFAEYVCPNYFRHKNYRSFLQNVRNWDFMQVGIGHESQRYAYRHEVSTCAKTKNTRCR